MDSEVINVHWRLRTEVVLQEIANEDPIGLERRTPFQQNRVFLGVVGSQDGHLCWNCKIYNHSYKHGSTAHLKFTTNTPDFMKTPYVEGDPGSGSDPSLLYSMHQIAGLTL